MNKRGCLNRLDSHPPYCNSLSSSCGPRHFHPLCVIVDPSTSSHRPLHNPTLGAQTRHVIRIRSHRIVSPCRSKIQPHIVSISFSPTSTSSPSSSPSPPRWATWTSSLLRWTYPSPSAPRLPFDIIRWRVHVDIPLSPSAGLHARLTTLTWSTCCACTASAARSIVSNLSLRGVTWPGDTRE